MKSILLSWLSSIHASFWYYPLIMSIGILLLSRATLYLDETIPASWLKDFWWFHGKNPEGARTLLSIIASSIITVISVTFSMTIVAISFSGSQMGPRLITNFMRDRSNQITLGIFVATFLYCILILRSVLSIDTDDSTFVPQISLFVAFLLAVCSIAALIYFFHHIPESINMSNVVARVGKELYQHIDALFPSHVGKEKQEGMRDIPQRFQQHQEIITSRQYGYIRVLDGHALIELAQKHNVIIQLKKPIGKFVTPHTELLHIYSPESIPASLCDECLSNFAYGYQRNQEQDTRFLIHQLIEIIGRVLSPGINDPYSAMTVISWLQLSLEKVSYSKTPSPYRYDSENHLRLIAHAESFADFCETIFCAIQPYVCKDRNTALYMMQSISDAWRNIKNHEHKVTLAAYANELKKAATECLPLEADRKAIEHLYRENFTS